MTDLISKADLLNTIGKECHYDTEHPLEAYAKLINVINSFPEAKTEEGLQLQDDQYSWF